MKKTYKIDVDCANCANKMEDAARKTPGVKDANVNFMTLRFSRTARRWKATARSSCKIPWDAYPSGSDCW